jgi:ketosteroid isomerase-like protein
MNRTPLVLLAAITTVTILAMNKPTSPDPAALRESLLAVDGEFGAATTARGTAGWLEYFDEETAIFPLGQPPITGLAAVRAHYLENGPDGLRWTPLHAEASADGTLGHTWGTWIYSGKNKAGEAVTRTGRYLTVWRRQKDGRWKIAADIGNTDPPPAAK